MTDARLPSLPRLTRQMEINDDFSINVNKLPTVGKTTSGRTTYFVLLFVLALCIYALREPLAFTHAQFYSEDGAIFFRDAFNLPLSEQPFARAQGNLFLLQRIIAAFVAILPAGNAPFFYAFFSSIVAVACCLFIVSERFEDLIPSRAIRTAVGLLLLVRPALQDLHATLGWTQWWLAFPIALMAGIRPPKHYWAAILDGIVLALLGLSSITIVLLAPLFGIRLIIERTRYAIWLASCGGLAAVGQLLAFFSSPRFGTYDLARYFRLDVAEALRVTIDNVFLSMFLERVGFGFLSKYGLTQAPWLELIVLVLGIAVAIAAASCARPRLLLICLYMVVVFPIAPILIHQSEGSNTLANAGLRYYGPSAGSIIILIVIALIYGKWRWRLAVLVPALLLAVAIVNNYQIGLRVAVPDFDWPTSAACVERLKQQGGSCIIVTPGGSLPWPALLNRPPKNPPIEKMPALGLTNTESAVFQLGRRVDGRYEVSGWAINPSPPSFPGSVFVTLDNSTNYWLRLNIDYPDIASRYGDITMTNIGFKATLPAAMVPQPGSILRLKVVRRDLSGYYLTQVGYTIDQAGQPVVLALTK
jgi:hypothetical protein